MRLYSFGGIVLPVANGDQQMPIEARSSLVKLPNGSFDQDGSDLYRDPVMIAYKGQINEDMDTELDTLLSMVGSGRRLLVAIMRDGTHYRQTWAKLKSAKRSAKAGEWEYYQPVDFTFEMNYPYWLASEDEPWYLDHGYLLDDGLFLDDGHLEEETINANPFSFTIANTGTSEVPRGTITLTVAAASSLTNPRFENAANGNWFEISAALVAGDSVVIDFLSKTITINGVDAYNQFTIEAKQGDWMALERGNNVITITADAIAGTTDLVWAWARHYL